MLLLDTNIVSEVMRRAPDEAVMNWLREQSPERVHLSSVTVAEIYFGLALVADTERRLNLHSRFTTFTADGFRGRIIDFGIGEAEVYGDIMASRRRTGRPMSVPDAQIAATAATAGFTLATRNTRDFADTGIAIVDPFTIAGP